MKGFFCLETKPVFVDNCDIFIVNFAQNIESLFISSIKFVFSLYIINHLYIFIIPK
jgi:hypothetical protein